MVTQKEEATLPLLSFSLDQQLTLPTKPQGRWSVSLQHYYLQWHHLVPAISMCISTEKEPGQTEQTVVKSPKVKWLLSISLYAPFAVSRRGMVWAATPWRKQLPGQHMLSSEPGKQWLRGWKTMGLGLWRPRLISVLATLAAVCAEGFKPLRIFFMCKMGMVKTYL